MKEIAVSIDHVSKRFKLYENIVMDPIKEHLLFWRKKDFYREFWAVKDVSLDIKRGEIIGIIGANGAGKTTLLKLIAGLLEAEDGSIKVNGKVTALLTLGLGFHHEFTGRENIVYGGMLLGMSKKEVLRKMPGIIEFAEIGDYIDRPFRTYSSGMKARLIFAASMCVDPDILLIDEALATGDSSFVQQCAQRSREICESGATIMFVSHNLRQVEDLCQRSIVMLKGSILFDGDTNQAISRYIKSVYEGGTARIAETATAREKWRPFRGSGEIQVDDVYFMAQGKRTETLTIGEPCELHIDFEAFRNLDEVAFCVEVYSEKSPITFSFLPTLPYFVEDNSSNNFRMRGGKSKIVITLSKLIIGDGTYSCSLEFYPASKDYRFSYDTCYCYYNRGFSFQAVYPDHNVFGRGTLTEIPVKSVEIRDR